MAAADTNPKAALGFLSVLDHAQHGLFGGYLVLSTAGRPIEFHCTTPIKPNRAQRILYGPTLESFLYGEQIGQTLLAKAKTEPLFVCTDRQPVLAIRQYVSLPVALVLPPEMEAHRETQGAIDPGGEFRRLDAAHPGGFHPSGLSLVTFQLGRNRLAVPEQADDDRRLITERLSESAEWFDLFEPFTRIHEAIEEAQRAVR